VFDHGDGWISSCPFVMFGFGARAMNGFRLRWLSERGRFDRGRFVLQWMLKKVPVWGGEWVRWSGLLCNLATGCIKLPAMGLASGTAGPEINGASLRRLD